MIDAKITRAELAAIVCAKLREALGDHPVLVGGAVVSIYTGGRYVSDDLDIVSYRRNKQIAPAMQELGFVEEGSHWSHPKTKLFVQFVNGPLMIGKKHVKEPVRMQTRAGELPTISAADSACDRLAWFVHDGDPQALEQAVDIIVDQKVPLTAVAKWLAGEGLPEDARRDVLATLKRKIAARKRSRR